MYVLLLFVANKLYVLFKLVYSLFCSSKGMNGGAPRHLDERGVVLGKHGDLGGTRRAELGGGWSTQSFSVIFGLLSSLLKYFSQGKTLRPALAEKSKHHRDICLPFGWSGPRCMSLTALP